MAAPRRPHDPPRGSNYRNRKRPKGQTKSALAPIVARRATAPERAQRQLPIRKHREERENGIASAVPFSHFSVDAVTFDISKTPIPL